MLLDDVKCALRLSDNALDGDVEALIAAAKADLYLSGISVQMLETDEPDALIKLAIVQYCKACWGWDNPDSEKYMRCFAQLERDMTLSAKYTTVAEG